MRHLMLAAAALAMPAVLADDTPSRAPQHPQPKGRHFTRPRRNAYSRVPSPALVELARQNNERLAAKQAERAARRAA